VSNPELITAFDLDRWSDTLAAQTALPILVRRLILATAPVSEITMRAGEGAQIPGWDGIVRCDAADAHVPLGVSGWELGMSKDPRDKAQSDIRNRAKDPLGLDPKTTTFVAVTSRIWRDRHDWREARRKERKWADVRAYDADDLVTWLERAPSVHHWISEQLGRDVRDVHTPKTVSKGGLTTAMTKDASAQALPPIPESADAGQRQVAGHVFISYVREDSDHVDQLQRTLEAAGIPLWRDTADLWPGEDWRAKIRSAIISDALVFLACFSEKSLARRRSYQNEEFVLAIEQMRLRQPEQPWLIPVRFDDCEIPDRDIGGGRTLTSIQRVDLFGPRYHEAARRLVAAILRILGRHLDPARSEIAPASKELRTRHQPRMEGQAGQEPAERNDRAEVQTLASVSSHASLVVVDGDHLIASLQRARISGTPALRKAGWHEQLNDIFEHLATFGVLTVYLTRSDTNEQRTLLQAARRVGAKVNLLDRRGTKGSNIDMVITTAVMMELSSISKLLLVTGDSDFVPLVKQAERVNIEVTVAYLSNASRELIAAAHSVLDLLGTDNSGSHAPSRGQRTAEHSVSQAERKFHQAMVQIYETAKRELGYNATRFLQMVSQDGGLATAKRLLWSDTPSDGFTTLWEHRRLDLTVEAHVLRDEFAALFTDDDRQRARERLEQYGWKEA
jgi:uncharacterized LabA/DUF88 family protein